MTHPTAPRLAGAPISCWPGFFIFGNYFDEGGLFASCDIATNTTILDK